MLSQPVKSALLRSCRQDLPKVPSPRIVEHAHDLPFPISDSRGSAKSRRLWHRPAPCGSPQSFHSAVTALAFSCCRLAAYPTARCLGSRSNTDGLVLGLTQMGQESGTSSCSESFLEPLHLLCFGAPLLPRHGDSAEQGEVLFDLAWVGGLPELFKITKPERSQLGFARVFKQAHEGRPSLPSRSDARELRHCASRPTSVVHEEDMRCVTAQMTSVMLDPQQTCEEQDVQRQQ